MDTILANAQARQRNYKVQFVFREPGEMDLWTVSFGKARTSQDDIHTVVVDARTAKVLAEPRLDEGFMHLMLRLHADLFAGLPGKLFLGFMGLLLIVAIISGIAIYGPFMRKLEFGTVRRDRTPRIYWLDLHNLLGIVTLAWLLVVGATGIINTWADLVIKLWQFDQMAQMTAPYKNLPLPDKLGSLEQSVRAAQAREPDMQVGFVAFPGTLFSSPHHYAVFMRGTTPLTARLLKPVLVDAKTTKVTDSRDLPWYVTALLVSQALHFGDYAGMPLKVLWAVLDIVTIAVLISGIYLWLVRRRRASEALVSSALSESEAA